MTHEIESTDASQQAVLAADGPAAGAKEVPHTKPPRSLRKDTRGLSTVEYAILLVLIVFVAYGLWKQLGDNVGEGTKKAVETIQIQSVPAKSP